MSALLDTSFTARDVPWAKIGAVIDRDDITAREAATLAGLDFDVTLVEAGFKISGKWRTVDHRRAIVREDTGQFLEYASSSYVPIQYRDAFQFLDDVSPKFVAGGSFNNSAAGFMVVSLPRRNTLNLAFGRKVDHHEMYCVIRTSHDRSRGLEVSVMALRGRCMNALTLPSFTKGAEQRWSVRHIGDPRARLAEAQAMITRFDAYSEAFDDLAHRLDAIEVSTDEAERALQRILRPSPRQARAVAGILDAWTDEQTNGFPSTGWGLVNAVSDYFQHRRFAGLPNDMRRTGTSELLDPLTGDAHRYPDRVAKTLLRR